MKVNLIGLTQPKMDMTADEFVAYTARVSNPNNQMNTATAPQLINYLIKNKHWSPFEMVHVCIEIESTRDIVRQILRHRSFSFQEFSQRYADPTESLGFETREARWQDTKNRQNSVDIGDSSEDLIIAEQWETYQKDLNERSKHVYDWAIDKGIAKEVARSVLPEGNTISRIYMSGTLRSWMHYCWLRIGNGTQKEHMEIAQACWELICHEFPTIEAAYDEAEQLKQLERGLS